MKKTTVVGSLEQKTFNVDQPLSSLDKRYKAVDINLYVR